MVVSLQPNSHSLLMRLQWVQLRISSRYRLEVFGTLTSGMYFIIVDAESNIPLWNGSEFSKSFNVAEASDDEGFLSGSENVDVIGLSALILILLLAVVVLARRGSSEGTYEYEYEYEDEVDKG